MAAAAVLFTAAGADAQAVTGKWLVEYPTRVRSSGSGEDHVEKMGRATLTIERVSGDSIFGKWHAQNSEDSTRVVAPRRIAGVMSGTRIEFTGEPVEAKVRRSMNGGGGDESSIIMRSYYQGTINGPAIEGTMYSESEDQTIKSSPMKWTARKAD